ncbi:MAG: glycosyl transferase, group 1 [Rhizorhabdus sp.]|nr:glycosyl transferase, group 1 [Rhizorhabdus sp.]
MADTAPMSIVMQRPIDASPVVHTRANRKVDLQQVEIILDLSRLLSRMLHPMPTGVDRVEMAYARTLLDLVPGQLAFAAVNPLGYYGRLNRADVLRFLDETEQRWARSGQVGRWSLRARAVRTLWRMRPRRIPKREQGIQRVYVQASPNHLHHPTRVESKLRREGAKFLCLVHDLIPIEFPEYARPNGAALHRRRMETLVALADGLIANSRATANSTERFIAFSTHKPIVRAAHLGTDIPSGESFTAMPRLPAKPYFVVISTIEPRKNHIMLLNIWRRMVEQYGAADTPHLILIGRRGWENENVVDMLERCEALQHHVSEYAGLSDRAVLTMLRGARALLLPSFAEGFGMPVSEALAIGTPVICSDLPALREAGCGIPDEIDPLDGPAWIRTIRDYSSENSPMRAAQMRRMERCELPTWHDHLETVLNLVAEVAHADHVKGVTAG